MVKDLVERLYELGSEIMPLIERHKLYSGEEDLNSGRVLHPSEVNPKNVQLRESVQALADLYPKAIEYNALAEIVLEEMDLDEGQERDIKIMKIITGAMIRHCKKDIDYAISQLPN